MTPSPIPTQILPTFDPTKSLILWDEFSSDLKHVKYRLPSISGMIGSVAGGGREERRTHSTVWHLSFAVLSMQFPISYIWKLRLYLVPDTASEKQNVLG